MTRTLRAASAIAALTLATGLAGCGSSDKAADKAADKPTAKASADTLTADEFRTKANALCQKYNDEGEKLGADIGDNPTQEQMQGVVDQAVALLRKQVEEMDALEPPKELAADYDAMLDTVRQGTQQLEDKGIEALMGDDGGVFDQADAKAKALGLDTCAEEE